jgi:hypothetical protein
MPDSLFYTILRTPYILAMKDEISRMQFYSAARQSTNLVEKMEREIERLRAMLPMERAEQPPQRGSAATYQAATPAARKAMDDIIAKVDKQIAMQQVHKRDDRDRRKAQEQHIGDERRQNDRRRTPRE